MDTTEYKLLPPRYFYVDGERARPDLMKLWPQDRDLCVKFTAVHTPSLKVSSRLFKQVHSLCVDSRPGDRLQLAKGPLIILYSFC